MPNWCHAELEIIGPEAEIKSIAETELDFEKILPTPADLLPDTYDNFGMTESQEQANIAIYGYKSWYEWRLKNWDTKWNANNKTLKVVNPTTITAIMDTAWSLPLGILKKLSKDHPKSTIQVVDCEEEAGFFVGSLMIQDGEIIEDDIHEPSTKELIKRGIIDEDDNG